MHKSLSVLINRKYPPQTLDQWQHLFRYMHDRALSDLTPEVTRAPFFELLLDAGLSNAHAHEVQSSFLDELLKRNLPYPNTAMWQDGLNFVVLLGDEVPRTPAAPGLARVAAGQPVSATKTPWAWYSIPWAWDSPVDRLADRVAPSDWLQPRQVSMRRYDPRQIQQDDVAMEHLLSVQAVRTQDGALGVCDMRVHGAPWVPVLHHPPAWWTQPGPWQPYRANVRAGMFAAHPVLFEHCTFVSNHAADGYANLRLDGCVIALSDGLVVELRADHTAWLWIGPAALAGKAAALASPTAVKAPPDEQFPRLPGLRFTRVIVQVQGRDLVTVVALERIVSGALHAAGFPMLEALRTPQSGESVLREDAKRAVLWQELLQIVSPLNKEV